MKAMMGLLLAFFTQYIFANSIYLEDIECKLMSGENEILIKPGTLSNSVCVYKDNEISCLHMDNQGNQVNTIDKYIVFYKNQDNELWQSSQGNITIYLDYTKSQVYMGMTLFSEQSMIVINKYCIGKIISH